MIETTRSKPSPLRFAYRYLLAGIPAFSNQLYSCGLIQRNKAVSLERQFSLGPAVRLGDCLLSD